METTNTFAEIEQLETIVSQLDYLLNEGVVMNAKDADQLVNLGQALISIGNSFNLFRP